MTDDAIRAAVESADTYQAAAVALGMQYPKLYAAARKLGVKPKSVAAKKERLLPAPVELLPIASFEPRVPAPEPEPPRLSPWVPLPDGIVAKTGTTSVRLDQRGRVRAIVCDVKECWASWILYDGTGARVGKIGLRGGESDTDAERACRDGADLALEALGWLRPGHAFSEPCAVPTPACSRPMDPIMALAERLLAASRADRAELGAELARLVVGRVGGRAA